ncbi:MAG: hypothetical protein OQK51_25525 [Kangiellaceae bacterium]|nr:hypothetical protein [Kangiellaceae bacterium]
MSYVYLLRCFIVVIGSSLLISCTTSKTDKEQPIVTRSLVSAKSYSHPTKTSTKEDMQVCRNTVAREQIDKCMSEKGWIVKVKRYD